MLEGDIKACFDEIDHTALMDRVRRRVGDKRVLGLVKAFLKAGVLSEDGINRDTDTGTPQGGILSPLLANIALSVLDDHFAEAWQNEMATPIERKRRRSQGLPNYRLVRYADDFVVLVPGTQADAEHLREEAAAVLAPDGATPVGDQDDHRPHRRGLRLPRMAHPAAPQARHGQALRLHLPGQDLPREGHGHGEDPVPPRATTNRSSELLRRLNPVLRGWTNYFRHGVSKATFGYLRAYTWARVVNWLRRKHPHANWKWLRRRYLPGGGRPRATRRCSTPGPWPSPSRYRGQILDVTPWATTAATPA